MRVPRNPWQALGRFACWVEPALITEWLRLMRLCRHPGSRPRSWDALSRHDLGRAKPRRGAATRDGIASYAGTQDRILDPGTLSAAMTWAEPSRDVALPRAMALRILDRKGALHCVWSGKRLEVATLDIDHCLPWSAWPCGDLWNLLPAHRTINRHAKRDRLPGETLLQEARAPILEWWEAAYMDGEVLPRRVAEEARASLPGLSAAALPASRDAVFEAISLQRLRHDQQVPEWIG